MSKKAIGSNAERELVRLFWQNGWAACRVAGSGSMRYPSPDIIASNGKNLFLIECKYSSEDSVYLPTQEVADLQSVAEKFAATPLIGSRFSKQGWLFVSPKDLPRTQKFVVVKRNHAGGTKFETLMQQGL